MIDGIPGDAMQKGRERWIPVLSADWGVSQSAAAMPHGGGAGAGKAEFRQASFTAWASAATPLLFEACATGRHARTATFEAVRSGERESVAVRWDFEDVQVANLGMSGADGSPTMADSFALLATRFRLTTFAQDARGGMAAPSTRGWDLLAARAW